MHFIKDLFEKNLTDHLHNKFIRYSKGNFVGPLLKIKITKNDVKIYASFHYTDELLILVANILGNNPTHIKGSLVWNQDLSQDLAKLGIMYSKVSKMRGIFKYELENDVPLKDFVETMGNYHVLVNVKTDTLSYVTKSSFPKPNKEFGADFCKVTFPLTMVSEVLKEFAFDAPKDLKQIEISHEIEIKDIELPSDVSDFDRARREAKRVGTIKRKIIVDGNETESSSEFKV